MASHTPFLASTAPRARAGLMTAVASVLAIALVVGLPVPGLSSDQSAGAAEGGFAVMRDRWVTYMLGDEPDVGDPEVEAFVSARTARAQSLWSTMDESAERTFLWADAADFTTGVDASIVRSFTNLRDMAYAYRGAGSDLQGDPGLGAAIVAGIEWLVTRHYKPGVAETGNWWNWEIGTPRRLGDLLALMHDEISAELRHRVLAAIDFWCGDPTRRTQFSTTVETGANRTDKALNVILRGIAGEDPAKVVQGRDALDQVYRYVTSGDGFYEDGSFVFHSRIAYTGGYGPPLLDSVGGSLYLLAGTAFAVTNPLADNVYEWLEDAFIPLVYRGAMMDMVRGRKITREAENDHATGRDVAGSIALFAQFADPSRAVLYKRQIKAWMAADPNTNYVYPTSLYITQLLKAIQADESIAPLPEKSGAAVYNGMGRAVQRGDDFAVGISVFSDRISSFTSGNGENLNGWWQGAGSTLIYAGDSYEFDSNYWATVDMRRLPGTTTDGSGSGTPGSFAPYLNTSSWAGGSTAGGDYGSFGMQFTMQNVTGSDLGGKKSWFMLGDKLVALGAAIHGSGTVETIVDDRLISGGANDVRIGNNKVAAGSQGVTRTADYAYIAGPDHANSVGYVFFDSPTVTAKNESRQGTWAAQMTGASTDVRTNHHGSLAIQHGTAPSAGSYAYAILPGANWGQTVSASKEMGVDVLRNDATVQAVRENGEGVVGANFFGDAPATVDLRGEPYLTSDAKASVTTSETRDELTIGVSDPTQRNTGKIHLEVHRAATGVLALDEGVTVTQLSPTVKLTVDVNKAAGKNFDVRLDLDATAAPAQPVLQATAHNERVTLTWDQVGGEVGYIVSYGTSAENLSETITIGSVSAVNRLDVVNLTNGTPYVFSVTAVGVVHDSEPSEPVAATPADVPNVTVEEVALEDAFVRDGAANEATNYGALDRIEVKTDGAVGGGFNRLGYVKFDLSQIEDRVDAATVTLRSLSGPSGTTNQLRAVATDAVWSESTVTYANRPGAAESGVSFPAPAAGSSVHVDVTDAVRAALAAGRSEVSLQVVSPFGQGSGAQVNYASSENGTEAARPTLTINSGQAPAAPQVTVGAVGPTSVTLTWPYVDGAQRFIVTQTSGGAEPVTIDIPLASAAGQNATNSTRITDLAEGTEYAFTVTAIAGSESATSTPIAATPQLAANPTVTLSAVADGYVRDGTANADLNFGAVSSMTVKNDAVGFTRQSYVKFDLTSVTGRVDSARLRLVPSSVGLAGITHAAALIADAAWQESTLTWNNRPLPGATVAVWTVPAVGTAVEVDLTDQLRAARAAGATSVTVVIVQTANQGGSSSASYATKESGTVANRPALKIN